MKEEKIVVSTRLTLSIVAACLVSFCGLLTETAVNIAFPSIMEDFNVTTQTVQWLTTGNLLTIAMITPLAAFLQKRFRIKTLFLFSTICFLAGSVCAFLSPSFTLLLVGRIIHGIATGVGVPLAFCIILEQVPFQKVGTYIGFGALVSAAAPALGPTYGGIITTTIGWKHVFSILIPILIFTLILGLITIKEKGQPKKVSVDILGILLIMGAFFCLVYAFANISVIAQNPAGEIIFFAAGIVLMVIFVLYSKNRKEPLIDVSIFKYIPFVCHLAGFFLINLVMLGMMFLLPNYLQIALGLVSMTAGLMLLPGSVLNAIFGPISGAILDKIGPKGPILTGLGLMTASVLLFVIFGTDLTPPLIIIFYIIFGSGCGIAFGNTMTTAMMRLPQELGSYGNTALNTLMQFAGAVGTSICAACVAFAQAGVNRADTQAFAEATKEGSSSGFLFLLALAVICIMLQIYGFYKFEKNAAEK